MTREEALIKYPFADIPEEATYVFAGSHTGHQDKLYWWKSVVDNIVFSWGWGYVNKIETNDTSKEILKIELIENKVDNEIEIVYK